MYQFIWEYWWAFVFSLIFGYYKEHPCTYQDIASQHGKDVLYNKQHWEDPLSFKLWMNPVKGQASLQCKKGKAPLPLVKVHI